MSTIHDSYLGIAEEVTYGTAVASARYLELVSEGLVGTYERIESEGFRAGQKVLRADRFETNPKGAEGDLKLEVTDSSFGLLFKHMLGAVSTGSATGGITPHTFTLGDLRGKSLTVQVGRVDNAGILHPFTFEGGKVGNWEVTNGVDGVLNLSLEMDFEAEKIGAGTGAYAAGTPTYAAGAKLFVFNSATVQVAGTSFGVSDLSFKGDNKLKTDRYFSGSNGAKREPLVEGLREISWELKGEFDGTAHATRVASALATGALATIVATWTAVGGGELSISLPFARFDEAPANFDGAQIMEHTVSGVALEDGTSSPISIVYKTKDAAP